MLDRPNPIYSGHLYVLATDYFYDVMWGKHEDAYRGDTLLEVFSLLRWVGGLAALSGIVTIGGSNNNPAEHKEGGAAHLHHYHH